MLEGTEVPGLTIIEERDAIHVKSRVGEKGFIPFHCRQFNESLGIFDAGTRLYYAIAEALKL